MAEYTRRPSLLIERLLGGPLRGIFLNTSSVLVSTTSTVRSASLETYSRLPSGAAATPWFASMPVTSPTTRLVAGSIMWRLSPGPRLLSLLRRLFGRCGREQGKPGGQQPASAH